MPAEGRPVAPTGLALSAFAPVFIIWFVVVASGLVFRPLLPVDETRYLTVAWEMLWRDDFLVPRLNGAPYAHKPPLLFWMINLVWWVFGVSETAARLVPAAFTLASAGLVARIARSLWPDRPAVAPAAALALVGFTVFAAYGSLVMFDVPLAFFVLVALGAVIAEGGAWRWVVFSLAFAAAMLTKGPIAAVFVLPPVLLAPLWRDAGGDRSWRSWYGSATLAIIYALGIVMAWALPAAIVAGTHYADAILWGQTAGRVTRSFAHAEPWWFYLGILPILLYPWILMPTLWRRASVTTWDEGTRFCVAAVVPAFCILAGVSGKQVHYLLPLLPFAALLVARRIDAARGGLALADVLLPALPILVVGIILSLGPALIGALLRVKPDLHIPAWLSHLPVTAGGLLAVGVLSLCLVRRRGMLGGMIPAASGGALLILTLNAVGSVTLFRHMDLGPISHYVAAHQDTAIAYNKEYEGEFGFLGRITTDIERVGDNEMAGWIPAHGGGRMIVRYHSPPDYVRGRPEFETSYRGQRIGVWVVPGATAGTPRKEANRCASC